MPIYEYEHLEKPCRIGRVFEARQTLSEPSLDLCPECGGPVRRILSRVNINTPKSDSELKDLGFTKLVRRDDGVYENVTRRGNESRYMERGRPETLPDLSKTLSD